MTVVRTNDLCVSKVDRVFIIVSVQNTIQNMVNLDQPLPAYLVCPSSEVQLQYAGNQCIQTRGSQIILVWPFVNFKIHRNT